MAKAINVYGTQQTNETIRSNVDNWTALHANKEDNGERARYDAEKIRKHKIRIIEGWRAKNAN